MKLSHPIRTIVAGLLLVATTAAATIPNGVYNVYRNGGLKIGRLESANGGANCGYKNNNTNNPTGNDAILTYNSGQDRYSLFPPGNHTVQVSDNGGGAFSWTKYDENGNIIDSGVVAHGFYPY